MKFFRIDLLTLLISLFILSSCKNQDGVGLDPDQKLSGTLLVDTNIIVNTVLEDSVFTSALTKTPLGYFNDPQIGVTESNVAIAISLPASSAYTLPTGAITIDSAILVLRYNSGFYGDSLTSKYKINVFQLGEKPSNTINYSNNKVWNFNPALLGSRVFNARPGTSFKITDIVTAAKDTLRTARPQLRVPLSPQFFQTNFFGTSSAALASNAVFQDKIKGLYLTMDNNQAGAGGTLSLALDSSFVSIYYKANNGTTIDTAIASLPVSTHAAQIKHTYTTSVQAVINNQAVSNSTFYVQGLGGLRTKISFPGLKDIATKAGGIVVNRAELVITPTAGSTVPFPAQSKISMYQLDNTLQRIELQDATQSDKRYLGVYQFGGIYNLFSDYNYHFIITGYIQDLMLGKTVDYGTYLGAVDINNFQTVDYLATPQTYGRLISAGTLTNKLSADYPYRIKLNIIYTKVTK